jgi:hypothetical protein
MGKNPEPGGPERTTHVCPASKCSTPNPDMTYIRRSSHHIRLVTTAIPTVDTSFVPQLGIQHSIDVNRTHHDFSPEQESSSRRPFPTKISKLPQMTSPFVSQGFSWKLPRFTRQQRIKRGTSTEKAAKTKLDPLTPVQDAARE